MLWFLFICPSPYLFTPLMFSFSLSLPPRYLFIFSLFSLYLSPSYLFLLLIALLLISFFSLSLPSPYLFLLLIFSFPSSLPSFYPFCFPYFVISFLIHFLWFFPHIRHFLILFPSLSSFPIFFYVKIFRFNLIIIILLGRFLAIDRGAEWIKVPDLNTARWGRPSVGTIGGKITGTVHCTANGDKIKKQERSLNIVFSETAPLGTTPVSTKKAMAGVLDETFSQLTPLSGVAVQRRYRPACLHRLKPCPSCVAWRAGMATPLCWLSWVRFV